MKLNYAIILLGDLRIEGWIDWMDTSSDQTMIVVIVDGIKYMTSMNNVLLMYRNPEK